MALTAASKNALGAEHPSTPINTASGLTFFRGLHHSRVMLRLVVQAQELPHCVRTNNIPRAKHLTQTTAHELAPPPPIPHLFRGLHHCRVVLRLVDQAHELRQQLARKRPPLPQEQIQPRLIQQQRHLRALALR